MRPVKLAAAALIPCVFLSRHPHLEGLAFVPEPQPTNPFVLMSTATATVVSGWPYEDTQFKVIRQFE